MQRYPFQDRFFIASTLNNNPLSSYETIKFEDIYNANARFRICFKDSATLTKDFDDDDFGYSVWTDEQLIKYNRYDESIGYVTEDSSVGIDSLECDGWVTARFVVD